MSDQLQSAPSVQTEPPLYQPQWSQWVRQFVTVFLVIAVIYAITLIGSVIQLLSISFLIAFLMYGPSRFIAKRTFLNFTGGVLVSYLALVLVIVFISLNVIPGLISAISGLGTSLQELYSQLWDYIMNWKPGSLYIEIFNFRISLDSIMQPVQDFLISMSSGTLPSGTSLPPVDFSSIIRAVTDALRGLAGSLTGFVGNSFLAIFLSLLLLVDLPHYQDQVLESIPSGYSREILLLIQKMIAVWRGFFRGQLTVGIIIGVLTWLQLTIMGISSAVTLAIIVAMISLIPSIGGIIALVPLALVPLFDGSSTFPDLPHTTVMLLVVGINLVVSQIIWNGVAPKIIGSAVALPLPVIIVGIVIGAAVGGVLGAFLVVPILGTLRVIVYYLIMKITQRDPYPNELAEAVTDLADL